MASNTTVLVVDDDPGLLLLMKKALQREGMTVCTASSGHEALQWLGANHADLMLLDLKLSDIEGKEVINHLGAIGRSLPFIVITGQGDERTAVEMMKRGALDYLVKDVNFLQFMPEVVKRALGNAARDRELATAIAERKELERAVIEIGQREQTRIGQDLHDGLGQYLAGIELMAQVLEQKLNERGLKTEAARAAELAGFVREAISQTRLLARGMTPFMVESDGLVAALRYLAQNAEQLFRIKCSVDVQEGANLPDKGAAVHLCRIAQEAISNAVRHGKASMISIRLQQDNGATVLSITDNGSGVHAAAGKSGMGLRTMKYRAAIIGGTLAIENGTAGGVTVVCTVPSEGEN